MTDRASTLSRAWRLARSRRLGVALTSLLAVFIAVGSLIAQGPYEDPLVQAWATEHPVAERLVAALGLHHAYSTPVFLLLVMLLVLSTIACSVERTSHARRVIRRTRTPLDEATVVARFRPQSSFALAEGVDATAALASAERGLTRIGLHVRRGDTLVDGFAGRWGAAGSPAFHWCLALLGIALLLGQATRAEGIVELPIGTSVPEGHASYSRIAEGSLFGERHTGVAIEASDLVYNLGAGGVNRGPSPLVTLRDESGIVARQRVYPNNPLRYGPLMIHMSAYGVAPVVSVEASAGRSLATKTTLLDFSRETSSGTVAQEFGVEGGSLGGTVPVRIEIVADRNSAGPLGRVPDSPRLLVSMVTSKDSTFGVPASLTLGEAVTLPDGGRLRFVSAQNWVRLGVANDWSVPVIYALSLLACAALFVALFVPTRGARIVLRDTDEGLSLGVSLWHVRRDAAFQESVQAVAQSAAEGAFDPESTRYRWRHS